MEGKKNGISATIYLLASHLLHCYTTCTCSTFDTLGVGSGDRLGLAGTASPATSPRTDCKSKLRDISIRPFLLCSESTRGGKTGSIPRTNTLNVTKWAIPEQGLQQMNKEIQPKRPMARHVHAHVEINMSCHGCE
jgi:hypothetical protein